MIHKVTEIILYRMNLTQFSHSVLISNDFCWFTERKIIEEQKYDIELNLNIVTELSWVVEMYVLIKVQNFNFDDLIYN